MNWILKGAARTVVTEWADLRGAKRRWRGAVSLHAHTHHSRESLAELPGYVSTIPVVSRLYARELRRHGIGAAEVDLSRGWWRPPVSPRGVFESEARQIEERLGAAPIVSITDHDRICAGLELRRTYAARCAPISFEWTVPWEDGYFHLGIHNLPFIDAHDWFHRLDHFTTGSSRESLADLIVDLHDTDGVLVVFNHPAWDIARLGPDAHRRAVTGFMQAHRRFLHAIEVNGYRSAAENAVACQLACDVAAPIVSGGDRHGCAPNALLNLTSADSFAEFAAEVRAGDSRIVVMPEYHQPLPGRMIASIADVLRDYEAYPEDQRRWTDRVSCEWRGEVRTLSRVWPEGGPFWVRSVVGAIGWLSSPGLAPIVARGFAWTGQRDRGAVGASIPELERLQPPAQSARPMNV